MITSFLAAVFVSLLFAVVAAGFLSGWETFRVQFHVSRSDFRKGERAYSLMFGTRRGPFALGAGYIGGATAYVALNCVSPVNCGKRSMYVPRRLQMGVTHNANLVPYSRG